MFAFTVSAADLPPQASCPFLATSELRSVLGTGVTVAVADVDDRLDGASSCRFRAEARMVILAETALPTITGDPFRALRGRELAPLEVPGAASSILVPVASLQEADAWYAGFAAESGVVLLWSDEDGFQSALLLDAADLSPEAQHRELSRLSQRLIASR